MANKPNAAPVVIKRKKNISGDGHHGGAWKVAYADFVTAMMAFFLLMWLLGSTTEDQRKGVADYFQLTFSAASTGGGDNVMQGVSRDGGNMTSPYKEYKASDAKEMTELKAKLDGNLEGLTGESMTMAQTLRHVVTKVTDEGLVIEVFDLDNAPLFQTDSTQPTAVTYDIARLLTEVLAGTKNRLAVNGYVRSYPVALKVNPAWSLSAGRADVMRDLLENAGVQSQRISRVTGHADRKPVTADPMAVRNNRIEITLLRTDR